ncbi:glycosyltransferase involved in cell wall biosynthesis [Paenibacillus cellulosilyticus]|uniref:Glycosyltransferase involved in cell wall biosynthesis n=1 Tax=Paenibacillus cellulosilyticus TaxID=375489 RepID=A0A2V2Z0W2_9BACL|nr:glycosyltransferase family 4 protein [Paenibacillus cellulosilyticus]PWW08497.1 glycosyltransferase involved in cell wall biosynthesis [Paenibacillus cellulosilyticus]QKS48079.1 glycosyltransferase family 4 protein [Paenibacillus cellulosilyticus]
MQTVSILTHSYVDGYNRQFKRLFGGGLERYIRELCGVIHAMGLRPVVHQLSYFEPFRTSFEGTEVIGYTYELGKVAAAFERMAEEADGLLIYASCLWHPISFKPGSIGICHGINWDHGSVLTSTKDGITSAFRQAVQQLDRIVSVDSHFQTYARAMCEFDDMDKIILLPNSVDTASYTPSKNNQTNQPRKRGYRVLVPRRLSYERGVITMMLAAEQLLQSRSDLVIEFAGELVDGTNIADAFRLWHDAHPAKKRIEQRAYSMDEMRQAYAGADIAVIPTIFSEGTSLSCLEAMSCGVPVVATNVGGLNDLVIDGLNGRRVPPNSAAIADAVNGLLDDKPLRRKFSKLGRETALAFDSSRWRDSWTAVIAKQLEARPAAP